MKLQILFLSALIFSLIISCSREEKYQQTDTKLSETQIKYNNLSNDLIKSIAYIKEPLKNLTDDQRAAVSALLVITRVASQQEYSLGSKTKSLLDGIWVDIPELCPPLPESTLKRFGDCRDQEMDYGVSWSKCRDEEKSEEECDEENAGELSAAVMCRMKEIEELANLIKVIPGRKWPPQPFPWPINEIMVSDTIQ